MMMMMIRRAVEANTEKLIKDYCCLFELPSKRAVVVISRRTARNCSEVRTYFPSLISLSVALSTPEMKNLMV